MKIYNTDCPHIAIENPPPMKRFGLPEYTQIVHPYYFGDEANKPTALWLKRLPLLKQTKIVGRGDFIYRYYNGIRKTESKWYAELCKYPQSIRSKIRSKTFPGIARAMAEQWATKKIFVNMTNHMDMDKSLLMSIYLRKIKLQE